MSHSFFLPNTNALSVQQVFSETGYPDIDFVEGYPTADNDRWPAGFTYLYRDRATARPIEVESMPDGINIRIFACSSAHDYDLACGLVTALAKLSGELIHPEDNEPMTLEEFTQNYDGAWRESHRNSMREMVLKSYTNQDGSPLQVSAMHSDMEIGSRMMAQFSRDSSRLNEIFDKCFYWLNYIGQEDVYIAPLIVWGEEDSNRRVRSAIYAENVFTLIPDKRTVVSLRSEADLERDTENPEINLTMDSVAELVGDQALWISENLLLLPPLSGASWVEFLEIARSKNIQDVFVHGFDVDNDPFADQGQKRDALNGKSLETLSYAPVIAFMLVALADGKVEESEMRAFESQLLEGIASESTIMPSVLALTVTNFETIKDEILNLQFDITERLEEVMNIVNNQLSEDEARHFKETLFKIGYSVAETSGGLFRKMGKKEKHAIAILASSLGLLDDIDE